MVCLMWPFGVPMTPAPKVNLRVPVETAAKRANLTLDAVARMMGISPQLLDQQIDCVGNNHLSMRRVFLLATDPDGRRFLREFWPLAADACGQPELADALRLADGLAAFVSHTNVKYAKAELRETQKEKVG